MIVGLNGTSYEPASFGTVKFRRSVKYLRFPSQRTFDDMTCKFKGFSGPIGSGKSKALVHEAIKLAYLNPGCRGLIGSPTYRMLADSTMVELLGTLDELGIPHKFHKQAFAITLHEPQSTILLRTMDEPERLRAMNLAWFGIDELTYCKQASWLRLEGRLRDPKAKVKRGFAVWTPKGKDWVWRAFISARKVQGYNVVLARPFENRAVLDSTPDFYENLKRSYDEKFYRQEVLGEYVDMFSGAVYHSFSDANVRPCLYDPGKPLIIAMDFNVNPMAGAILQEHKWGRQPEVHVLQEIVLPSSHTIEWCRELVRRIQPWADAERKAGRTLELRFYGDAAGRAKQASSGGESNWSLVETFFSLQTDMRSKFRYSKTNPEVVARVNSTNSMLCSFGQGYMLAGERYVRIDPSCTELIADYEEVEWKVDAHGNTFPEIDKSNPKRTHISDAVGYYFHEEHSLLTRGQGAVRQSY
jgi:phage terminase large subunit